MLKGHYKDVFPKMLPARNWDPQRPSQPTIALPCPKKENGKPELVLAGMILSVSDSSGEKPKAWTLGVKAGETPTIIAVAQDPTYGNQSMNVNISNSLVGLPCTGNFRICTPFFKRGVAYPVGTALTYVRNDEIESDDSYKALGKLGDYKMMGCVKPAAEGDVVIGYVVRSQDDKFYGVHNYDDPTEAVQGGTELAPTYTYGGVNLDTISGDETTGHVNEGAFAMRKSINEAVCSLAMSENSYFIEYDTAFQPTKPTA